MHQIVAQQPEVGVEEAVDAVAGQVVRGIRPVAWQVGGGRAQHLLHGRADSNGPESRPRGLRGSSPAEGVLPQIAGIAVGRYP